MILIHINLCFYPTNWYVLTHINSCHKNEIESWRYLSSSWLSHCLSLSSRCATLLSCAIDCRCPRRCPVHCLPPSRCVPLPRCRRRCRAAATALPPLRCAPPPGCRRCHPAAKLPPPPLTLPPLHRLLVGCCVVVRRPILSLHAVMQPLTLSLPA
jgi:hypothetical protein